MNSNDTTPAARIVKILDVVDTRDYVEVGDTFKPVPGSGNLRECDRCGRVHEVHATVELSDGTRAIVGTSCAGAESLEVQKALAAGASRAKRVARQSRELAALRAKLAQLAQIAVEVEALPLPTVVGPVPYFPRYDPTRQDGTAIYMGEAEVRIASWECDGPRKREQLAICWRAGQFTSRAVAAGFKRYGDTLGTVRAAIADLEKRIAR